LAVIPIGSNITPIPPAGYDRAAWRKRWEVRPEETLLGYFGFLNPSKGGEDLIQTLNRLKSVPVKLMMIGGRTGSSDPTNQAYAEQIDALIARLGLQERVLWTGFTPAEQVSANLLATDICILPYRDGISFRRGSLMAALAHGLPIISTTPAVELPELRHRHNIYLVPPSAPEALAEAVIALRENRGLRERLADGAGTLARAFRWDSIAEATVELFADMGSTSHTPFSSGL
jgi:glycosyltransferase involved in cell wall biosynthesis